MRSILILLFCAMGMTQAIAQNLSQYLNAAEKAYMQRDYYASLSYYLEALEFDSTDIHINYEAAESARNFMSYSMAEKLYRRVVDKDSDGAYPLATFRLAQMLQMKGKYDEAQEYYRLYLSEQEGEDEYYTARAKKGINSTEWAAQMADEKESNVKINRLGEHINTPYSEFGAVLEEDGISYSSHSYPTAEKQIMPEKTISKILKAKDGITEVYSEDLNKENKITAHTAYNINKSRLYYTICDYYNGVNIRCALYSRAVLGDGSLGEEIKLPSPINMDSTSSTQPNVGFDRQSGKEVLFFVSDRDSGEGKMDIYKVEITGVDTYGEVENLSDVNTAEDDMTPFFHNNSQVLYFSSKGYTTLGGLDIYGTTYDENGYGEVINLGAPTNSSYNDLYYVLDEDGEKALFSSNREGANYIDPLNESCCYDIYEAEIAELMINLNAITFDANTLDTLSGAKVQLFDQATGELITEMTNDMGGDHKFSLDKGKNYLIVTTKPGFAPDTMRLNTGRIHRPEDIVRKIYLKRVALELDALTFDNVSKLPLKGVTVTLRNLTDETVEPVTITNAEGHDFSFLVKPGHKYSLSADRERYNGAEVTFIAQDEDGSGKLVRKLFLDRKDLNIYLPLAVYFDNDRPDERTVKLTTDHSYTETFDQYIQRQEDFVEEYTKGLSAGEKTLAEQRVRDFFNNNVKTGFDRFEGFLSTMLRQLRNGKGFELSVKGYASPRADSRYNLALSQRRVVSVLNELKEYAGGAFNTFIENGQLKITELSYGENLAPSDVSDVFYDRRNSVYSPEASKERRVEIVEIKSQLITE